MSRLVLAVAVMTALCVPPTLAITVDANLTPDWGVTADTDWAPDNGAGFSLGDDVVHSSNSGGEWYDIEALYLNLNLATNSIEWGLVTSYGGAEPASGAALPPGVSSVDQLRNGTVWDGSSLYTTRPWRRHPVLALSFDGDPTNWEYGIIMAPNQESQSLWAGGFTDSAELWKVGSWRGAHPNEFGPGTEPGYNPVYSGPVDFDVGDTTNNSQLATGSTAAGYGYGNESPQVGRTWWQSQNFIWEGTVAMPTTEIQFGTWTSVDFTYALWCANNHTQGDRIGYGSPPPSDDSPEAATWALLLCTAALGGFTRRRRS